ncbi:MAG: hypothetical protein LBN07_01685 [Christensenellaceae bacterium]|jgi:hypothetical protein|nr:hypothetical protein [Christensenellaceae bacterium]
MENLGVFGELFYLEGAALENSQPVKRCVECIKWREAFRCKYFKKVEDNDNIFTDIMKCRALDERVHYDYPLEYGDWNVRALPNCPLIKQRGVFVESTATAETFPDYLLMKDEAVTFEGG